MRTPCPGCRHPVPAGRWCNRCGTPLVAPAAPRRPRGRPRRVAALAAAAGVAALVAVAVRSTGPDAVPTPPDPATAIVLPDDAPPPPAPSRRPVALPTPPGERVDVICSDLQQRSVAASELSTQEPGAVVDLVFGTCVVMGPEGVTVP